MRRQLTIAIKRNETWPESAVIAAVKRRLNKITQVSVRVRLYDGITMVYTFKKTYAYIFLQEFPESSLLTPSIMMLQAQQLWRLQAIQVTSVAVIDSGCYAP